MPQPDKFPRCRKDLTTGADTGNVSSGHRRSSTRRRHQTDIDAKRLAKYEFPVRQICTGGSCHLDARMIELALAAEDWDLTGLDYLFIENVGNLVCPSSYDLGEHAKIVILSVTEGEDKPLKYPAAFSRAGLVIINKIDLLPFVQFDIAKAKENVLKVHPGVEILEVSAATGANLDEWYAWLEKKRALCAQVRSTVAVN
ncbi:MAG TPA: hydrogenase nickel incorporation protein HypB [Bryobacteraceae bacterium]|nr:hydrogenase nickel incorporation protein HypB [Bryobacteraceae bacterium]